MRRRAYLSLATGGLVGLAGCLATGPSSNDPVDGVGCPSVLDADRRLCPGDEEGPLTVERSAGTLSGPAWSLQVTVTNRSGDPLGFNPRAWSLYRRVGSDWSSVVPDVRDRPRVDLAPGEVYAWQLSPAGGRQPGTRPPGGDQRVLVDLPPGRYAFAAPFQGSRRVAVVVPFAVEG